MKTNSIFFSITILFLLSLSGFVSVAVYYMRTQPELHGLRQYNSVVSAINGMLKHNVGLGDIDKYLRSMDFVEVKGDKKDSKRDFLSHVRPLSPGSMNISVEKFGNDVFISIRTHDDFFLYEDSLNLFWDRYHTITLVGVLLIASTYILILKRLAPLRKLRQEMKDISDSGEIRELTYRIRSNDEISSIYYEFNRAMQTVVSFSKARSLFLRSIMHELKTPIAKGRIVAEMVNNDIHKGKLCNVFEILNSLINDFARLEEITSKHYRLKKNEFLFVDLVDKVCDMLLIDRGSGHVEVIHNNDLLKADFDLFTLSVKNLVDNSIKYSPDSKVILQTSSRDLFVKNKGSPLKLKLEDYFEPFSKYNKNPDSPGFGLGMYIIKNTLDAQNLKLSYQHVGGYNIFRIHGCVVESFCTLSDSALSS